MARLWTAWILLLAVQSAPEIIGQFDLPSPYGADVPFYGERVPFVLGCLAFVAFVYRAFQGWYQPLRAIATANAVSALVATLLATPEPGRFVYPAVMAWAQFAMFLQLLPLISAFRVKRHRHMASTLACMQFIAFALFVYAQTGIGLTPVPTAAFYWLHGAWAELAYPLLGTLLMIWASWDSPDPRGEGVHA